MGAADDLRTVSVAYLFLFPFFALSFQVLSRHDDLKLIFTSATADADNFTKFFGNIPMFTIPGQIFPSDVLLILTLSYQWTTFRVK